MGVEHYHVMAANTSAEYCTPNTGIRTISRMPGVGEWRQPKIVRDVVESRGAIDDLLGVCVCVLSLNELVGQGSGLLRRHGHLAIVSAWRYVVPRQRQW